jgi:antitoxin (DNA-binding transcriptional repressor) of toxin-antitoxin stability system
LKEVEAGERYYITRHDKPIAELKPVGRLRTGPRAGFAAGTFVRVAPDFDAPLERRCRKKA